MTKWLLIIAIWTSSIQDVVVVVVDSEAECFKELYAHKEQAARHEELKTAQFSCIPGRRP